MKRLFRDNWPFAALSVALIVIFSQTLGRFNVLPSPDSVAAGYAFYMQRINTILSGLSCIDIYDIAELFLPPEIFCDFTYPLDALLIALGLGWFLRTRGMPRPIAALGGVMFALMGYSFTLVSAGHRGFFTLTVHTVFLFAFLARGLEGKGTLNYALAGICAAWALRRQPDFAAIYLLVAALYWLAAVVHKLLSQKSCAFAKRSALGATVSLVAFALAVFPSAVGSLQSVLQGRMVQISESTPTENSLSANIDGQPAEHDNSAAEEEKKLAKWIFTTNWSLPPDELLEFVAPAIMGRQTMDAERPYWGRLGRAWKWEESKQGFFNYRQHLIYIGALPLSLAIFAVAIVAGQRRKEDMPLCDNFKTMRFEVCFWSIVWIVGAVLAMGRYTPVYRLFHALPYFSLLRAPVKFIRLVELSTAILASWGIAVLVEYSWPTARKFRCAAWCAGVCALSLAVFALLIKTGMVNYLAPLRALGADAPLLAIMTNHASIALLHGVAGFGVAAAMFFWRGRGWQGGWRKGVVLAVIAAVVCSDAVLAYRPFAAAANVEYKYTARNPVTNIALSTPAREGRPSVWLSLGDRRLDFAMRGNLDSYGVCDLPHDFDQRDFFENAGRDAVLRAMELGGCKYAVLPAEQAANLPKARLEAICGLVPRNSSALFDKTMSPGKNGYVVAKVLRALPDAQFFTRWSSTTEESLMRDTAEKMRGEWSHWTLPVVGASNDCDANATMPPQGSQTIKSVLGLRGARKTVVDVDAPQDGYLLLNWVFYSGNAAWLDGAPVQQLLAGYRRTAIFVPAGRHTVEFSNCTRHSGRLYLMFAILVFFAIGTGYELKKD